MVVTSPPLPEPAHGRSIATESLNLVGGLGVIERTAEWSTAQADVRRRQEQHPIAVLLLLGTLVVVSHQRADAALHGHEAEVELVRTGLAVSLDEAVVVHANGVPDLMGGAVDLQGTLIIADREGITRIQRHGRRLLLRLGRNGVAGKNQNPNQREEQRRRRPRGNRHPLKSPSAPYTYPDKPNRSSSAARCHAGHGKGSCRG